MNIISLFSGCGGLDLGFQKAGFNVVWANEKDQSIWETYEKNHPSTILDKRSISNIPSHEIPDDIIGIIGGPPCQSWSNAGTCSGIEDPRGKLFYEFIRVLKDKQPYFFLAENVEGMLSTRHNEALKNIIIAFDEAGYKLSYKLLNAAEYGVPQNRKRVIFVGFRNDLEFEFEFPSPHAEQYTVRDAIGNIKQHPKPALDANHTNGHGEGISNHEYWQGSFSYIFMSRNRVLNWDKPSYTIQASGRQVSLHPNSPDMIKESKDVRQFSKTNFEKLRRLTIRECARIQTFPDEFIFYYSSLDNGYKMVGNAVPVDFAFAIAIKIYKDLTEILKKKKNIADPQLNIHLDTDFTNTTSEYEPVKEVCL